MRTVTLGSLRLQAQQRADMVNSLFLSTAEWNQNINNSACELYDLLTAAFEDYNLTMANIAVVPGTSTYSLPSDFYKSIRVELVLDAAGNAITLKPYMQPEANSYAFTPTWNTVGYSYLRYHIQGNNIRFVPVPNTPQSVNIWYVPVLAPLASDSDTMDGISGWEEFVVIDAAIKALQKEDSDVQVLLMQKAAIVKRIENMSANRDAGMPMRVVDVTRQSPFEFWGFGEGNT